MNKPSISFHLHLKAGLGILIFLLSAWLHVYLVSAYTLNFPLGHDDAVISLVAWPEQADLSSVLAYLFGQKNGHPQIIQRFSTLCSIFLTGEVNFHRINTVISLVLVLIAGVYVFLRRRQEELLFTGIVGALVLSFSSLICLWVSGYTAYMFPYLFFGMALFIMTLPPTQLHPLLLFCALVLCMLSFSAGLASAPVAILFILYRWLIIHEISVRDAILFVLSVFLAVIVFLLVSQHYDYLSFFLPRFFADPMKAFNFIVYICGSLFTYLNPLDMYDKVLATTGSLFVILVASGLVLKEYSNRRLMTYYMVLILCVVVGVMGAIGRAYYGQDGLAPQYEYNGIFFAAAFAGVCYRSRYLHDYLKWAVVVTIGVTGFIRTYHYVGGPANWSFESRTEELEEAHAHVMSDFTAISPNTAKKYRDGRRMNRFVKEALTRELFSPEERLQTMAVKINREKSRVAGTEGLLSTVGLYDQYLFKELNQLDVQAYDFFEAGYIESKNEFRWAYKTDDQIKVFITLQKGERLRKKGKKQVFGKRVVMSDVDWNPDSSICHDFIEGMHLYLSSVDSDLLLLGISRQTPGDEEKWRQFFTSIVQKYRKKEE